MTHQTVSLAKYWKLFPATSSKRIVNNNEHISKLGTKWYKTKQFIWAGNQ